MDDHEKLFSTSDFRAQFIGGYRIEGATPAAQTWLEQHSSDNYRVELHNIYGDLIGADATETKALLANVQREYKP